MKKTGVPFLDVQHAHIERRKRDIALRLKRDDPEREKWLTLGLVLSGVIFGALFMPLWNGEIGFFLSQVLVAAPMLAFIAWVSPRNQRLIPEMLGFSGCTWQEAVLLDRDRYLREQIASKHPAPRPIGFRV